MTGRLALVGSGEYLPQMAEIERDLLVGRPGRYVQLATAAALDGPEVVAKWHRLGREQAERLGVEAVVIPVLDRDDAEREDLAALIEGAGLVYLSGGHPTYLADTLRGTAVWRAIEREWRAGASLAGCSAGAMALTSWVPSIRHPRGGGTRGLDVVGHLRVIPHFDAFAARMPGIVDRFITSDDVTVLGIDEDTAIVGGPYEWHVEGRQSAWRLGGGVREELPSGTTFTTP